MRDAGERKVEAANRAVESPLETPNHAIGYLNRNCQVVTGLRATKQKTSRQHPNPLDRILSPGGTPRYHRGSPRQPLKKTHQRLTKFAGKSRDASLPCDVLSQPKM